MKTKYILSAIPLALTIVFLALTGATGALTLTSCTLEPASTTTVPTDTTVTTAPTVTTVPLGPPIYEVSFQNMMTGANIGYDFTHKTNANTGATSDFLEADVTAWLAAHGSTFSNTAPSEVPTVVRGGAASESRNLRVTANPSATGTVAWSVVISQGEFDALIAAKNTQKVRIHTVISVVTSPTGNVPIGITYRPNTATTSGTGYAANAVTYKIGQTVGVDGVEQTYGDAVAWTAVNDITIGKVDASSPATNYKEVEVIIDIPPGAELTFTGFGVHSRDGTLGAFGAGCSTKTLSDAEFGNNSYPASANFHDSWGSIVSGSEFEDGAGLKVERLGTGTGGMLTGNLYWWSEPLNPTTLPVGGGAGNVLVRMKVKATLVPAGKKMQIYVKAYDNVRPKTVAWLSLPSTPTLQENELPHGLPHDDDANKIVTIINAVSPDWQYIDVVMPIGYAGTVQAVPMFYNTIQIGFALNAGTELLLDGFSVYPVIP